MHITRIVRWVNLAALRLSVDVLKEARLKIDSAINMEILREGVLVKPVSGHPKRYTLDKMFAACDPQRSRADRLGRVGQITLYGNGAS